MSESGILLIDNNCYRELVDPSAQRRLRERAELVDLIPAPSSVNLAESICAAPAQREQLLSAIRSVVTVYPLLPWPSDILVDAGRRLLAGEGHGFEFGETGLEWLLDDPTAAGEDRAHTHAALLAAEERASARFNAQRANIQRWIKDHEAREQWDGAREFLDYWWDGEMAEVAARFHWKLLALPGDAPIQLLFGNEPWRLMVDIEAMLMYARCVVFEQAKKVGYVDLIQLLYMSIRRKRVLVTNDMPFFHAATAVLTGRYANAKVITLSQLME